MHGARAASSIRNDPTGRCAAVDANRSSCGRVAGRATSGVLGVALWRAYPRPAMTPIGTASSNGISFAWFYDSPGRTVVACRVGQAGDTLDCKARATLPPTQ